MQSSTSPRSWRQSSARGASAASGTLGKSRLLSSTTGFAGSLSLVLLSLTLACNGREPQKTLTVATPSPAATTENYPSLAARAQEVNDAFNRKDFARFMDLTYPKVIELAGGREKMLAAMNKELKEMESEGVVLLSSTSGAPTQFLHESGSIYAVVPNTLKVKAQDGIFQTEGSMIGISPDGGVNWTFIDASGKDLSELKKLLPGIADKLNLPPDKPPVKISNS
jgi:hypothetical protein